MYNFSFFYGKIFLIEMGDTVKRYTKEELIGQKLLVGIKDKEITSGVEKLIQKYKVGGFILYRDNYDTYEEMIIIIKKLKELNRVNRIPLLICVDQENGVVNRLPEEFHRIKNALASSICDEDTIKEIGDITSEILYRSGVNMNFAPTLEIYNENISSSIGNRCFGKDSDTVIRNTKIIMNESINNKVIPVIKHFPGLGKIKIDTHLFLPTLNRIGKEDIKPFIELIKEKAPCILLGHVVVKSKSKKPASLSKKMNTELRDKYKFKGITITDDLKMRSVRYRYGRLKAAVYALKAGNDIIMFNYPYKSELRVIKEYYELYKKYEDDIKKSAKKIIKLKEEYEINDNDFIELTDKEIKDYNKRIDKVNKKILKLNNIDM